MEPKCIVLNIQDVLTVAGFPPGEGGKTNIPVGQEVADLISRAAEKLVRWEPGEPPIELTVTGPAPVWVYLVAAHSWHGRVRKLTYCAPNATIIIWAHGC